MSSRCTRRRSRKEGLTHLRRSAPRPRSSSSCIPVAYMYDDTAVDAGAQGAVTPCNAVIKDTVETPEELHAEEEPQESPTPLRRSVSPARDQVRRRPKRAHKAYASKANKSCTASRAIAVFAGGNKGAQHYYTDELVALGGAQTDKMSGDNQDGGGPAPTGLAARSSTRTGRARKRVSWTKGRGRSHQQAQERARGRRRRPGGSGTQDSQAKGGAAARSRVGMIDPWVARRTVTHRGMGVIGRTWGVAVARDPVRLNRGLAGRVRGPKCIPQRV